MDRDNTISKYLVPLDGSVMAEAALLAAVPMAQKRGAGIILLHVIEKNAPETIHGEKHLTNISEAQQYLESLADGIRKNGITAEIHVHPNEEGDVARSLVEHSQEMNPAMIIMSTHGRGGLKGFLYGSIAQQVLQKGICPILLIPPMPEKAAFAPRRILVPLDGSHSYEPALKEAAPIAKAFGSQMHLVLVIPTRAQLSGEHAVAGKFLPGATKAVLELAVEGSSEYLERVAEECRKENLSITGEILRGDTVVEILEYADKFDADLMVMSSHGHSGINAFLAGSVAPRITGRTGRPLLLIRTEEKER